MSVDIVKLEINHHFLLIYKIKRKYDKNRM